MKSSVALTFILLLLKYNLAHIVIQLETPEDLKRHGFYIPEYKEKKCEIKSASSASELPSEFGEDVKSLKGGSVWYLQPNMEDEDCEILHSGIDGIYKNAKAISIKVEYYSSGNYTSLWYGPSSYSKDYLHWMYLSQPEWPQWKETNCEINVDVFRNDYRKLSDGRVNEFGLKMAVNVDPQEGEWFRYSIIRKITITIRRTLESLKLPTTTAIPPIVATTQVSPSAAAIVTKIDTVTEPTTKKASLPTIVPVVTESSPKSDRIK